jgi:hypothetical protein
MFKIAIIIFNDSMRGRYLNMAGKAVNFIYLQRGQRPVYGYPFITLIFAQDPFPPCSL